MREALSAAGYDCRPGAANFVFVHTDEPLAERLEAQGIVVRPEIAVQRHLGLGPDPARHTVAADQDEYVGVGPDHPASFAR